MVLRLGVQGAGEPRQFSDENALGLKIWIKETYQQKVLQTQRKRKRIKQTRGETLRSDDVKAEESSPEDTGLVMPGTRDHGPTAQ